MLAITFGVRDEEDGRTDSTTAASDDHEPVQLARVFDALVGEKLLQDLALFARKRAWLRWSEVRDGAGGVRHA